MQQNLRITRARRFWILMVVAAAGLVTLAGLAVPNGGPWINTESRHCPEGMICADWDLEGGGEWASCCIPADQEFSYDISACNAEFRHFDHGE